MPAIWPSGGLGDLNVQQQEFAFPWADDAEIFGDFFFFHAQIHFNEAFAQNFADGGTVAQPFDGFFNGSGKLIGQFVGVGRIGGGGLQFFFDAQIAASQRAGNGQVGIDINACQAVFDAAALWR